MQPPASERVEIRDGRVVLAGDALVPSGPRGVVVFAHGSGSSRLSPRNTLVARALSETGFATLLFDLLTPEEGRDRALVFDVPLLARRLLAATAWIATRADLRELPVGYFGASTGAAAALAAAAEPGVASRPAAIVSRGGRPDLAGASLAEVTSPTLLIVGGADPTVLELNRAAARALRCPYELAVVPGATHLFEEPGTLEQVVRLAIDWFARYLRRDV